MADQNVTPKKFALESKEKQPTQIAVVLGNVKKGRRQQSAKKTISTVRARAPIIKKRHQVIHATEKEFVANQKLKKKKVYGGYGY